MPSPVIRQRTALFLALVFVLSLIAPSAASAAPVRWIGFYQPYAPIDLKPLSTTETTAKAKAHVSSYYQNVEQSFAITPATNARAHGSIPLVTLEFFEPAKGVTQPRYTLDSFTRGDHDAYLRAYARGARAFGTEVWVRPFHEMNGYWYPWCGTVNTNTPGDFVPAWKHVVDIFREEGASNVKFVWCPNFEGIDVNRKKGTAANAMAKYWPGDAYVDYIALDGFNWGPARGFPWRSFDDLYTVPYAEVTALSQTKPIFIAETSSTPDNGDKVAWISQMFSVIPQKFPRIEGVVWFNAVQGKYDWRLDSSPGSVAAFVAGSSGPQWLNKTPTSAGVYRRTLKSYVGRPVLLSGLFTPALPGDSALILQVRTPGSTTWSTVSQLSVIAPRGAWWRVYTPTKTGRYEFRTRFSGDFTRLATTSPTLAFTVR